MKLAGILQAAIILLLLAMAASCEVGKEYSSRVFGSNKPAKQQKDSLEFLPIETVDTSRIINTTGVKTINTIDSTEKTETLPEVNTNPVPRDMSTGTKRTKRVRQ